MFPPAPMVGNPSWREEVVKKGGREEEKRGKEFFSVTVKPSPGRAVIARLMRRLCISRGLWAGMMGLLVAWMFYGTVHQEL